MASGWTNGVPEARGLLDGGMTRLGWMAIVAAVLTAGGAVAVVFGGVYDVSATKEHVQPLYTVMETTMHASVRRHSAGVAVPALGDPAQVAKGAACFRDHCVLCHGAPGVAQGAAGQGMQPLPGPLVDGAQRWRPAELYWITRHGIKMSGMPAWEFRFDEAELWAVVAFLQHLPSLDAAAYGRLQAGAGDCELDRPERVAPAHGRAPREQALMALRQYACTGCHEIPGAVDSGPQVGPPLAGFGRRSAFAGAVPNTRENLMRWIRSPQSLRPGTAMPDLEVSDEHAAQMADYLLSLK